MTGIIDKLYLLCFERTAKVQMTNDQTKETYGEHQAQEQTVPGAHSRYTYTILGTDTDYTDQLQMHSLFSMMQEAASLNADVYGWGSEVLDPQDICWLLLRISVRMTRRPSWQEKITIETWSRGAERIYFLRDFLFFDEAGEKIGTGSSIWILANKATHKPVRPSAIMDYSKILADPAMAMAENPPKIEPIAEKSWMAANLVGGNTIVKYADFSEIDRNLHVNNTRYVAWCMDAAHNRSLDQGDILGIDINYNSEIHFGEKVVLFFREDDEQHLHVDGYVADGDRIAFSAVLYKSETIR